ncbi:MULTISPECIES: YhjD/YihY/BrkB family envelope integrity protein [unclassified Kribbella]|uniref:YhjD/YihY/BrkB family envelope integrity protein n=1 Tax=unclassified Kribbella TaxID=2644121 RepID=UPI0037A40EA0|nr:YihY/virulence factor BrkB family protein [Kribbella sp. NBC_00889]
MSRWAEHPLVLRVVRIVRQSVVWRIVVASIEIRFYDRALTLAGQAFIALIPLLVVLATWFSSSDSLAVGDWVIDRFSLTGPSADAVRSLFGRPPGDSGGLTFLSVITVLVSASSFARSVQRTYELAWNLPARGLRRTVNGIEGAFLLLIALILLGYLASLADELPVGLLITVIAQICTAVPGWWLASWLLLSRRVSWRLLFPGAVVSAVAQVVVTSAGAVYVPHLIERNTERYGVIGVAIALISWLVVLALVIVGSAVVGAQLSAALAEHDERRT